VAVTDPQRPGADFLGGDSSPQLMRGAALLVVAVLIGVFLLANGFDEGPSSEAALDTDLTIDTDDESEPTVSVVETTAPTTSVAARPPEEVTVLVANGTEVSGTATQFSTQLAADGYVTAEPGTGDNTDYETSVVYFNPDSEAEATAVASALGIDTANVSAMPNPVPTRDGDLRGASVLVIVGSDLAA
jgi:hypothetical protein